MGITVKEIERASMLSTIARHPVIALPPHIVTLYTASILMSSLPGSFTVPIAVALATFRAPGGASNATVSVSAGTGFTSGMTLLFEITGLDENYDRQTEIISCTGTTAANVAFPGVILFSWVEQIRIVGITGAASGSGASFSVGCGDGDTAFARGGNIRILHPVPGLLFSSQAASPLHFIPHGLAATGLIIPSSSSADGRHIIFAAAGYGTGGVIRAAVVVLTNVDGRGLI
jgi:hypothetical protein